MFGYAAILQGPHGAFALAWDEDPDAVEGAARARLTDRRFDPIKLFFDLGGTFEPNVCRASWPGRVDFPQAVAVVDGAAELVGPPERWAELWAHFPGVAWSLALEEGVWRGKSDHLMVFWAEGQVLVSVYAQVGAVSGYGETIATATEAAFAALETLPETFREMVSTARGLH